MSQQLTSGLNLRVYSSWKDETSATRTTSPEEGAWPVSG